MPRVRSLRCPAGSPWPPFLFPCSCTAGGCTCSGNMLFLFVFGRSIEDRFGHFHFLLLYLISGVAAAVVQIIVSPGSRVPTIGASGAIAGVLGAYFICYPRRAHHHAHSALHYLLDGPSSRHPAARLLVPHSVRRGIPDAFDTNRHGRRRRLVGPYWGLRLRRTAGPHPARRNIAAPQWKRRRAALEVGSCRAKPGATLGATSVCARFSSPRSRSAR